MSSTGAEDSETDAENDVEINNNMAETLQTSYIDADAETADEASEKDLDDDQMMMIDDQLALMFKDRAREKKSKGGLSRLVLVAHVDVHPRGGTKRSDTFQKPHLGSFGHFRSTATHESIYFTILSTTSRPYILR